VIAVNEETSRKFRIRHIVMGSGERLPLLTDAATGHPLYGPTVFALSEMRATNKASATIEQALRGLMVFQRILNYTGIDLEERLRQGRFLNLGEVDEIVGQCRLPMSRLGDKSEATARMSNKVAKVEGIRMSSTTDKRHGSDVSRHTADVRLLYICKYLEWMADTQLLKMAVSQPEHQSLEAAKGIVLTAISERIGGTGKRHVADAREGLSREQQTQMLQVVDPNSPNNPWHFKHARIRNHLSIVWLLKLGIRRGELLNVRISDIDFQKRELLIARRADDPLDPRSRQPNVKTKSRLLALDDELVELTHKYITSFRRALRGARKHDFLFVSSRTGAPMTLAASNQVFDELRTVPGMPAKLSPHVLRHTWNDNFSTLMDENKVPEEQEKKT